ncbi:MAG TPA: cytochrome c/FTR1 family iron permease, partial [Candidatus Elarobacter sp.]|nr:cytochrome c/FTR1 family iron permease [Candidatus Elarobacter sp.]
MPLLLPAQDAKAKRLASIVAVAVEEYGKGVDSTGKLISKDEYAETTSFLKDAQQLASTLQGPYAASARATLDTLESAAEQRRSPAELHAIHTRFVEALGSAGAMELPSAPLNLSEGKRVFAGNCAACHGEMGLGDGPSAKSLSTPAPAIGSAARTTNLTPTLAYNVVSVGVRGTAMPAFATSLTPQQRWNAVNYVYSLRGERMALPAQKDSTSTDADRAAANAAALLDSAMTFAKQGNPSAAGDRAFDAYLAFEPLESPARAKDPALVSSMERMFADFKGAVRRNDLRAAEAARESIVSRLPSVVDLTRTQGETAATAFWQSFLIILREGFEAILVIGAVVAFLIKMGHRERLRSIWVGVALAVVASAVTAFLIKTIFAAIPASRELVEAVSLLIAVVVLFSVSYWLISKVEAAKWQKFIRGKVTHALEHGGGSALMLVAFLAVYREGAETALFYQALFSAGQGLALPLFLGILVGFAALTVIFVLFYRFGVKIPMRPFFTVTSLLLYYMAFVFAGRGIRELQEGNVVSMTYVPHVPHIDWLGMFPTAETLLAQAVLVALFVFALV